MRHLCFLLVPALIAVFAAGCNADLPIDVNDPHETGIMTSDPVAELEQMPVEFLGKAASNVTDVLTFGDEHVVGTSRLLRTDSGVSFALRTSALEPGEVVTLWLVIFNEPDECDEGCGEDDLFNPDAKVDVLYGAGRVIGGTGETNYAGRRNVGDNDGSIFAELGLEAHGLLDAHAAEIHLVVRSHGPKIPNLTGEMLHTFNAGCEVPPGFPDPLPEELGAPGPNECEDVQFAVHMP